MTDLSSQKRMAADVLDVGESRVWIDPDRIGDVEGAITKQDIRNLVESGVIQKEQKKGVSRKGGKGKQGPGSRKGKKGARKSSKKEWTEKIRALRARLKEMRDEGDLTPAQYRKLYDMASGGFFRNRKHMELYIEKNVGE